MTDSKWWTMTCGILLLSSSGLVGCHSATTGHLQKFGAIAPHDQSVATHDAASVTMESTAARTPIETVPLRRHRGYPVACKPVSHPHPASPNKAIRDESFVLTSGSEAPPLLIPESLIPPLPAGPSPPVRVTQRSSPNKQPAQPRILDLADDCLPSPSDVHTGPGQPIASLSEEFEKLKLELKKNQTQLANLQKDLSHAHAKIAQLKQDVDYWKNEVTQLQEELRQQHVDDVAVLNELSNELGRILSEQRNTQNAPNRPPDSSNKSVRSKE
ncbi:hypothetical protein KOR42_45610 [Thalassoglobus neptunius]|uniref:Uncharacterized protein n=1 Tax=Thalassoglobus neptunius TaxID=1938619 RepID=A0A5C5VZ54_9PLAN|nr:hypothetical protein [Thalassoglobus neptunius]TWT43031.1 hypothetical protein KOR42_45610 [Thalassoglobus neptunius]